MLTDGYASRDQAKLPIWWTQVELLDLTHPIFSEEFQQSSLNLSFLHNGEFLDE